MKTFLVSLAAAILLAVAASSVLDRFREPAYRAFETSGARVDHPGDNLVGPDWSGLPPPPPLGS